MEVPSTSKKWFKSLSRRKSAKKQMGQEQSDENLTKEENSQQTFTDPKENPNFLNTWKRKFRKTFLSPRESLDTACANPSCSNAPENASSSLVAEEASPAASNNALSVIRTTNFWDDRHPEDLDNTDDAAGHIYVNMNEVRDRSMAVDKKQMERYCWYWGALSRQAAQRKLTGQPNGAFLVRDSQTDRYQFTLSFRSQACTLHSRIDRQNGFWVIESGKYDSVVALIEDAMKKSKNSVFCYVRAQSPLQPRFPVSLKFPISRFNTSLQHLCRVVIQKEVENMNRIDELPLPQLLITYLKEDFYENI